MNREFGITLLVIEHNMRVIMRLAEYICCLAHGELLAQGQPDAIQNDQRVINAYLGGALMVNQKHWQRDGADVDEDLLSVDDVAREAALLIGEGPSRERISELAGGKPQLSIVSLRAGYGKMEILHGVNLQVAAGQSLCMIGPNGAGKSTVLHSIYGFIRIIGGSIRVNGEDITRSSPNQKLEHSCDESAHLVGGRAFDRARATLHRYGV